MRRNTHCILEDCNRPLSGKQKRYCSTTCRERAQYRAKQDRQLDPKPSTQMIVTPEGDEIPSITLAQPATVYRNSMFRAWYQLGMSTPTVVTAFLTGGELRYGDEPDQIINFKDDRLSTAQRWLQLSSLLSRMTPKEMTLAGEPDPELRALQLRREEGVAELMDKLNHALDERLQQGGYTFEGHLEEAD